MTIDEHTTLEQLGEIRKLQLLIDEQRGTRARSLLAIAEANSNLDSLSKTLEHAVAANKPEDEAPF